MSTAYVRTTTAGQPLRVEIDGARYRVAADPVQWFERRAWWEEVARAPKGRCPHLVDRELWQVQVAPDPGPGRRPRAGRRPGAAASPGRSLRTIALERDRNTGTWTLLDMYA